MTGSRKFLILAALGAVLAGCGGDGGSEDHNQAVIDAAGSEIAAQDEILAALDTELNLGYYAGVDDTFTPDGVPCEPLSPGETSNCCSIQNIVVGDDVEFSKDGDNAIVGPDDAYVVEVGNFVDSDPAACLQAVSDAVDEVGVPSS